MATITKSVSINAAPASVMGYISDVKNHTAFIAPLKSVENISGDAQAPGTTWDWTFEMAGVQLTGQSETLAYEPGAVFKYKTHGGIDSTFTYAASPAGEGTNLTIEVEYEVPATVLGAVADKGVVEGMNAQQADAAADNIKAILEG